MGNEVKIIIKDAYEYNIRLITGIKNVCEKFYGDNEKEGCLDIPVISEGIDYIIEVSSFVRVDNFDTEINMSNINNCLKEIVEAIENEDYILVADILNYEIVPILEIISNKFQVYLT